MVNHKIAFIHPDLGIGGAERLIVDAAVGLQNLKNEITIYTSHCDKSHCFEEVGSGELKVVVYGDFLPTKILQRFHIVFSILRQLYLVLALIASGEIREYDYFIVDQLSFCVPFLKLFSKAPVLFYCHFPDQLLSHRRSILKRAYRIPFDLIEEWTTALSDKIVVNSKFTRLTVYNTFRRLEAGVSLEVIYPCVDVSLTVDEVELSDFQKFIQSDYILSVNRFERTKNIDLALKAYHKSTLGSKLVIAGGWDSRVTENVQYLQELQALSKELGIKSVVIISTDDLKDFDLSKDIQVFFFPSVSSNLKNAMIKGAQLLLYTPSFEHFGIVPVESMLLKTPVLGANNGGPLETIVHYNGHNISEATGYNEEPQVGRWSVILSQYNALSPDLKKELGENGRQRAIEIFSREKMSEEFLGHLHSMLTEENVVVKSVRFWKYELVVGSFVAIVLFLL